jgi:hypothetical protein
MWTRSCRPASNATPNPRLQRTPLRAPLSRKPLGDYPERAGMRDRILRLLLLSPLGVASTFCTSATPGGEKVVLYRYQATAEFLTTEDRVKKSCKFLSDKVMGQEGGVGTRQEVRNYAASIGSDTVLWWEYSESPFKGGSRAEFYVCKQTPQ